MNHNLPWSVAFSWGFVGVLFLGSLAAAADAQEAKEKGKAEETVMALGKWKLTAPAAWSRKQPRSRIIAYEFAAPASEGDKIAGRVTVMSAGGSIKDNIDRWVGQFVQPDGEKTKAKVEKKEIAGQKVSLVDISGTFKEQAAPFAGGGAAVERKNFRMLGAIIETEEANFFVKFYGPAKTMADNDKAFQTMIDGLSSR